MKVGIAAWGISVRYRVNYLREAQKYSDLSPSKLALYLTEVAIKNGYTTRRSALSGGALISAAKLGKAPLWLCRAALDLILEYGYLPDSDDEWVSLVSLLVLNDECIDKNFLKKLPEQVNYKAFLEWLKLIQ